MPIGPQLPSSPTGKRKRAPEDDDSGSDDNVGPPLPPSKEKQPDAEPKKARILGPSLLSSLQPSATTVPQTKDDAGTESSDDDDFGPTLPSKEDDKSKPATNTGASALSNSEKPNAAPLQRDEWMTLAPASGDWSQRVDPTKLKSRKFNTSGRSSHATSGTDAWHETPEQKQVRLQREMLGTKESTGPTAKPEPNAISEEDEETRRRMQEYNKARGPSLYEAHTKGQKGEEDDDPSKRAFDREKDIAGGLQINATQRREMMKKSGDFSSRFSSAKYL